MELCIGIAGRIGSGKSTLARMLAIRYNARIAAFADCLKGGCQRIKGAEAYWPQEHPDVRTRLQYVGFRGRKLDAVREVWITAWKACFGEIARTIIPDVRFENEVKFVQERGGFVLFAGDSEAGTHESEQLNKVLCDVWIPGTDKSFIQKEAIRLCETWRKASPRPVKVLSYGGYLDTKEAGFPASFLRVFNVEDVVRFLPEVDVFVYEDLEEGFNEAGELWKYLTKPLDVHYIHVGQRGCCTNGFIWNNIKEKLQTDSIYQY